jgi:hypothetical protein
MRTLAAPFLVALSLVATEAARADLGLTITTLRVHSGGMLRGYGNASGMPVYLVPENRAPPTVALSQWPGLLHTTVAASAAQAVPAARVSPAHRDAVGTPALRLPCATRVARSVPGSVLVQALRTNVDPGGFDAPRAGGHGPPLATLAWLRPSHRRSCRSDLRTVAWASVRECHPTRISGPNVSAGS